ncbi:MAG: hypothetical protein FJ403_06225 [Verrucomicrobia bacterium]|nr:hypothetical protein [Verrucomicrobiota bacterium]
MPQSLSAVYIHLVLSTKAGCHSCATSEKHVWDCNGSWVTAFSQASRSAPAQRSSAIAAGPHKPVVQGKAR